MHIWLAERDRHSARIGKARPRSAPNLQGRGVQRGLETLKDLKPGMILEGAVTNVAAFGAFVDIGVHQDGLVHISAMSKSFIKDPREVVIKSGDIVKVKVLQVDVARKRISLTLCLDEPSGGKTEPPAQGVPRHNSRVSTKSVGVAQGAGAVGWRGVGRSLATRQREKRERQNQRLVGVQPAKPMAALPHLRKSLANGFAIGNAI
jgi:transcriptional accessory protein Tex/SPT6